MAHKNTSKYVYLGVAFTVLIAIFVLYSNHKSNIAERSLESKFIMLNSDKTNQCSGPGFINMKKDDERLQGSCCSPMDFQSYKKQINGLKKYSNIKVIPQDPYDIPVSLARQLLNYQKTIKLTSEQQKVYDEAVKLSDENGPCCCKCWRWYAFEGLAKYLITNYNFNAEQIAEVWDLEDGCGGAGHDDDHNNM